MYLPIPVWLGVCIGIIIPVVFFIFEYRIERSAPWVTLTPFKMTRDSRTGETKPSPEGGMVDFDPRHGHYMKLGEVLITLASASLVFIPSLHFSSILPRLGFPMVLLGFTVVYALGFMAALTYFYEMFLFDPRNFTAFRSSLIFSLGFGAFFCFALAYITLAIIVGNAIANGTLLITAH
jgi:hypothetical protein